ncbi:SAM-dependent methyltransferase [Nannocystaceae bacterium ST9]
MEQPSTTAETVALFRALESTRPSSERLFSDPAARRFLRPTLRVAVELARLPPVRAAVEALTDRLWPGARSSGVARTRLIDDWLSEAHERGIEQFVLLGAGFDSRSTRLEALRGAKLFELDRGATQQVKRARMAARDPLASVRYLPVDFGRHDFVTIMRTSDFDRRSPSVFVWEGVSQYLQPSAVERTLRSIAKLSARGSELIFTYVHRAALAGDEFEGAATIRAAIAKTEEPWLSGLVPEDVPGLLRERGFELIEDLGADDYRARYRQPPQGGWGGYAFYHVARARLVRPMPNDLPSFTRFEASSVD